LAWIAQSDGLPGMVYALAACDLDGAGETEIIVGGERELSSEEYVGYLRILKGITWNTQNEMMSIDNVVLSVCPYSPCADSGFQLLVGTGCYNSWWPEPMYYGYSISGDFHQLDSPTLDSGWTSRIGETSKIMVSDLNGDGVEDIVCGSDYTYFQHSGTSWSWDSSIRITVCSSESTHTAVSLKGTYCFPYPRAEFDRMEIGDYDNDGDPDVVISYHMDCDDDTPGLVALDAHTWNTKWRIDPDSAVATGLSICQLTSSTTTSLCVAYQNGIVRIKDGANGNDLAVSQQLPRINHFAIGNLDQDPMIEICLASDDTLYIYESPSITTDVEQTEQPSITRNFSLFQNYPNPFNPETTIRFNIPFPCKVSVSIYNIKGERVRVFERSYPIGIHTLTWDGKNSTGQDVASGIYFYRLTAIGYQETKKMVLVR
jgi:hypothetical protein